MNKKTVFNLQQEGAPMDLVVVLKSKWNPQYSEARKISNSKFDYYPSGVAYCKNVNHVRHCVNFCRTNNIPFRVRSGGHQHEGMSSGNNLLVIALSEINEIEYTKDKGEGKDKVIGDEAWIPVGKQLQKVYDELEKRDQIIPGGGCQSVNVGGLTHGGGWGVSIRKYGMTCDNVIEAEMVLADGRIVYPSATNHPDLFWGLKGGGGGNFGIVTRFKFKLRTLLSPTQKVVTSFRCTWKKDTSTLPAIKAWLAMQRMKGDKSLTRDLSAACGMFVDKPDELLGAKCTVKLRMGGLFYGNAIKLKELLSSYFGPSLLDEAHTDFVTTERTYTPPPNKKLLKASVPEKEQPSLVAAQAIVADFLNPTVTPSQAAELLGATQDNSCKKRDYDESILPPPPNVTCDAPHPHKVTSSFPKLGIDDDELAEKIHTYLAATCYRADINQYMSFHCMGGAVYDNPEQRAFPWSDRPYMLQVQAWWNQSGNAGVDAARATEYDKWVHDFRKAIEGDIEGAFINFVDKDLVDNWDTPEGKLALLSHYYGDNLARLRSIKSEYDSGNLFEFGMSIPTK